MCSVFYDDKPAKFHSVSTEWTAFAEVIRRAKADVVVFETCMVAELCVELGVGFFLDHDDDEAWLSEAVGVKLSFETDFHSRSTNAAETTETITTVTVL